MVISFFSNPLKVLVFVCDNSDEFPIQRPRLFRKWHKALPNDFELQILMTGDKDNPDSKNNYIAILSRKDLKYKDILHTHFIDKIEDILEKS